MTPSASTVLTVSTSGMPGTAPAAPPTHRRDDPLEHRQRGEAARGVVHQHDVDVTHGGQAGGHRVGARGAPGDDHGIRRQLDAGPGRPGGVGEPGRGDDDQRRQPGQPADGVDGVPEQRTAAHRHEGLGQGRPEAAARPGRDDDDADAARGSVGVGHVS